MALNARSKSINVNQYTFKNLDVFDVQKTAHRDIFV